MYPYINVFGKIIPTYGLCMVIGFLLAAFITASKAKKKSIPGADIIIIAASIFGGAVFGGWLLFVCVTYPFSYIIDSIAKLDFSFIFNGGIVFYGGLFGGIAGAFAGAAIAQRKLTELENEIVPTIPLGHAIGRIGCLLSGCCYGIPYDGFLAVSYRADSVHKLNPANTYFPVQLLEAVLDIAIFIYLLYFTKKAKRKYDMIFRYLFLYAIMRFFTEMFRGDTIRGIHGGISTSQWVSIGLVALFIIRTAYVIIKERKNKT